MRELYIARDTPSRMVPGLTHAHWLSYLALPRNCHNAPQLPRYLLFLNINVSLPITMIWLLIHDLTLNVQPMFVRINVFLALNIIMKADVNCCYGGTW